jgi:hypothetical protein
VTELEPWEKDPDPKTPFEVEWVEATMRIGAILRTAKAPEDVLAAFDVQSEWLRKYPGDMPMRRLGSSLIRAVEWLGGDWDEFKPILEEHRKTRGLTRP